MLVELLEERNAFLEGQHVASREAPNQNGTPRKRAIIHARRLECRRTKGAIRWYHNASGILSPRSLYSHPWSPIMAEMTKRERDTFRRKQTGYSIRRASERVFWFSQAVIAAVGLMAVILLNIPELDGPFRSIGISNPDAFAGAVVTVVVVSIFFDVRSLVARKSEPESRHFSDPMEVYPMLLERARRISRSEEKILDVIGMTLYTAWPSIQFWLNRSELSGWTVRFTAVTGNKARSSKHVPEPWFREAQGNLDSICRHADHPTIRAQHITLQAFGYDFMPSLHGYRLGNGDLFYSILLWQEDGNIGKDGYSYEFVPSEDKSPSAEAIRQVFDSWFKRAVAIPWPTPTNLGSASSPTSPVK